MSGFQVGVGALEAPAQRLQQISADLASASSGASAAAWVGGAAGDPRVASALEVYRAGVTTVLGALGEDAGLLAQKVQLAGVTYEAVDGSAMPGTVSSREGAQRGGRAQ